MEHVPRCSADRRQKRESIGILQLLFCGSATESGLEVFSGVSHLPDAAFGQALALIRVALWKAVKALVALSHQLPLHEIALPERQGKAMQDEDLGVMKWKRKWKGETEKR